MDIHIHKLNKLEASRIHTPHATSVMPLIAITFLFPVPLIVHVHFQYT